MLRAVRRVRLPSKIREPVAKIEVNLWDVGVGGRAAEAVLKRELQELDAALDVALAAW